MLLFIDESYQKIDDVYHLALGGIMIPAERYRQLMACLYQLKERYFISDREIDRFDPEALKMARRVGIVVSGEKGLGELKAKMLLGPRVLQYHQRTGKAQAVLLVAELLTEVESLGAVTVGTVSVVDDIEAVLRPPRRLLPRQFAFLLERANEYVTVRHPNRIVIPVFDEVHLANDHTVVGGVADFMFRTEKGQNMRNLLPTPFFVNSALTAGVQVADIVVSLMRHTLGDEESRSPWQPLIDKVYNMAGRYEDGKIQTIYRVYE